LPPKDCASAAPGATRAKVVALPNIVVASNAFVQKLGDKEARRVQRGNGGF
jgi:hypothetical protein